MPKPRLILIRGIPGSGKSTLAQHYPAKHIEADMYFVNAKGEYQFDSALLPQAHQWCQQQTEYWLRVGESVVVANTFIEKWELRFYLDLAASLQITPEVIEASGDFANIHGVSEATVKQMQQRFEALD